MKRRIAFVAVLVVLVGLMLQNRTQAPVVPATQVASASSNARTEAAPDVIPVSTTAPTIAPAVTCSKPLIRFPIRPLPISCLTINKNKDRLKTLRDFLCYQRFPINFS
jgi:hypothetical protein